MQNPFRRSGLTDETYQNRFGWLRGESSRATALGREKFSEIECQVMHLNDSQVNASSESRADCQLPALRLHSRKCINGGVQIAGKVIGCLGVHIESRSAILLDRH